nr:androgen-dependent TFPI-regulating protein isoform X1 [Pogona vitticeps]
MRTSSLFAAHGLAFAWYVFLVYSISHIARKGEEKKPPAVLPFGGPWKFLTVLNLVLQAIFYGVTLLVEAFVLMKKQRIAKSMFPFRDLLFGALAFPISTFVFTSFWILYTYDRQLVYPKNLDLVIPEWMNHAMHTAIFPLALLELFTTPRRYPSKGKGFSLLGIAGFAYTSWVLWIYSVTGKWVYPVFEVLSPLGRVAFFSIGFLIMFFIYNVGEFLCRMIWGDSIVILDIYKKKSK